MDRVMKCAVCGAELTSARCDRCGADNETVVRLYKSAGAAYNLGLKKAREGRYTEAADALLRSVRIDKTNLDASNLLGLCYYAVGRVGDAARMWGVSRRIKPDDQLSAEYLGRLAKDAQRTERMSEAIGMYNNALQYLGQRSEDMAVIQLRKAIDMNPNLIAAMDLLTACYLGSGDTRRAAQLCDRALAVDRSDPVALDYYTQLHAGGPAQHERQKAEAKNAEKPVRPRAGFSIARGIADVIFFLLGAGIVAFLMMTFVVNPANAANEKLIASMKSDAQQQQQALSAQADSLRAQISDKADQVTQMTGERDAAVSQTDIQKRTASVYKAADTLAGGDPLTAIDMLRNLSTDGLPQDAAAKRDDILAQSALKIETDDYDAGLELYKAGKNSYADAEAKFKESLNYTSDLSTTAGNCNYYLGRISEADGDKNSAKIYYEKALTLPDSLSQANSKDANSRLKKLG